MQQQFIHLHLHSEYSMSDGIVRIKPLIKTVAAMHMPAVAITDQLNLFAAVKFFKAAIAAGVKPIIGSEVLIKNPEAPRHPFPLVLLCQNHVGFRNLTQLLSRAYLEGQDQYGPRVEYSWVEQHHEGLIALSGGLNSDIGQAILADQQSLAEERLQYWNRLFPGRFYLELQRTGRPHENRYNQKALQLSRHYELPVVATNDVRFIVQEDYGAHEARVCIHDGVVLEDKERPQRYNEQQYLRSAKEMCELFADLPAAIENTVEIAKRCNLQLVLDHNYLPTFPTPEGTTEAQYLEAIAIQGLERRLQTIFNHDPEVIAAKRGEFDARLQQELSVINAMGFAGYFLIVADFIQWSKEHDIPVGPGRGSGAGSLVAYALMITDLDPLKYELLFERFLNPERVSMPDFDIDFCMEGRDRVIEYVAQKYGRDSVAQIITYGTMAAKAVVRDVGRVFGYPYGFVDKIAKLIPFEVGMTLEKALEQEADLKQRYQQESEVTELIDLALKLEGIVRNAGKHAGGVVIAPSKLTDFTPLYCEAGGENLVTQFDKDDVEAVGLVKFDFLGLRTLTIIKWAVDTINEKLAAENKPLLDIATIPTDDPQTFELLKACQTTAVFQLESRGMKDLIHRLQPDDIEEVIALVALFRPGPLQSGMVDDFIARKHGREAVEYLHPDLTNILKPTYGVIVYQEQVMQIAQVLAGYTLGGADLLRRAMGKKKPEEMAKQRVAFVSGALNRGVEEKIATYVFDLMEKFAGYGFNKSHSAAYAILAYQTGWLKAHYPAEFMAAVLSADLDNTDKVVTLIEECEAMKLEIMPPNINQGFYKFTVNAQGKLIYGLGALKGVGEAAVTEIVAERKKHGDYQDLFEFCRRVDLKKLNRRTLEVLIRSGSCDCWGVERAVLFISLDKALKLAEQVEIDRKRGQQDLFTMLDEDQSITVQQYLSVPAWSHKVRLQYEKETLGLYLTGHPFEHYRQECKHFVTSTIKQLQHHLSKKVTIAGLMINLRHIITKHGKRMAIVTLDDGSSKIEVAVFSEVYEEYKTNLQPDEILIITGEVSTDNYTGGLRMSAQTILSLSTARQKYAKYLLWHIPSCDITETLLQQCQILIKRYHGNCKVVIAYHTDGSKVLVNTGAKWTLLPSDAFLEEARGLIKTGKVEVVY